MTTIIQIAQYQYPIGWEWLHDVPLGDWQWLIDIFATTTDDVTTYKYATFIDANCNISENREDWAQISDEEWGYKYNYVNQVDSQGLAKFLNDDQGYDGGIREYGYYIAAKALGIKSEGTFMENYEKIKEICNRP